MPPFLGGRVCVGHRGTGVGARRRSVRGSCGECLYAVDWYGPGIRQDYRQSELYCRDAGGSTSTTCSLMLWPYESNSKERNNDDAKV